MELKTTEIQNILAGKKSEMALKAIETAERGEYIVLLLQDGSKVQVLPERKMHEMIQQAQVDGAEEAIDKAIEALREKARTFPDLLGQKSEKVKWLVRDVIGFFVDYLIDIKNEIIKVAKNEL